MPQRRYRNSRSRSTRGASRDVKWANVALQEAVVAIGGQSIFDILGQFTVAQLQNISAIVKVFIDFSFQSENVNVLIHGAFGLHVLTDDAMGVPVTMDPTASGEPDAGWYFIKPFHADRGLLEAVDYHYETKTSRRLPSNSTMAFILDNDATSDGTLKYSVNIRTLVRMK